MKGTIANFRMSKHHQTTNQMIIKPENTDTKEKAVELIGKEVVWKSPAGKEIKGKITKEHGRNGFVRVLFETGMPGQSITNKVDIK